MSVDLSRIINLRNYSLNITFNEVTMAGIICQGIIDKNIAIQGAVCYDEIQII